MKFLENLFNLKKKNSKLNISNPEFKILKDVLPKETDFANSYIYHIKSFELTDSNIKLFEENKNKEDFYKILKTLNYNSQKNNVNLYYIITNEVHRIYLVSDPLELFEKEQIIHYRKYYSR